MNSSDSSVSGDASFVEEKSYDLSWEKEGDVWHRFQLLLPSGSSSAYPGKFTPNPSSGWNMFMEWHNPYCSTCTGNYSSSYVGIDWWNNAPHLLLRVAGGNALSPAVTDRFDTASLLYDHWYDILVRFVYSDAPEVGWYEFWVDGKLIASGHAPTIYRLPDGLIHGNRLSVGHYRKTQTWVDTNYVDGIKVGSTRSSVQ